MNLNSTGTLAYGELQLVAENPPAAVADVSIAVERDLGALEQEWRRFERQAVGHVFQSYEWVSTWYNSVGRRRGVEPQIVTGRSADGRILFLLPLALRKSSGLRVLNWLGGRQADLKCGMFEANFLQRLGQAEWKLLWRDILAKLPPIDCIHFPDQPERMGMVKNPFVSTRGIRQPDRTHSTILAGDWQSYYAAKRSGPARREDRRRTRKLEAEGELRFEVVREPVAVAAVLKRLFIDKAKLLARMGVRNPFVHEDVRSFYATLAERMHPQGLAHLSTLTLNGEPIAIHWGAVFNRRFYYLLPAYDMTRRVASPGTRQLSELMRWCLEAGLTRFDFGVGEQDYKNEWCEDHMPLFAVIEGRSLKGRAVAAVLRLGAHLKRRIKTSKTLWPLAQAVRVRLRNPKGAGA